MREAKMLILVGMAVNVMRVSYGVVKEPKKKIFIDYLTELCVL